MGRGCGPWAPDRAIWEKVTGAPMGDCRIEDVELARLADMSEAEWLDPSLA